MTKIAIYSKTGEKSKEIELNQDIFGVTESPYATAQAVRVQRANIRKSIAHTKNRGEVSGGGRKPWKQKGTGNARAGSSRSPIWVGGGITFGPTSARNFAMRLPKKITTLVIKSALSDLAQQKRIIVLEDLVLEKSSTSKFEAIIKSLPIEEGKILLVLSKSEATVGLSAQNIPYIKTIPVNTLNILDLLKYNYLVLSLETLTEIEKIFSVKNDLVGKELK